jgi:S1-C subfamily serine protease
MARSSVVCCLLVAAAMVASGCAGLVEAPPGTPPEKVGPKITPEADAARGISRVAVPTLSQNGFQRRAESITLRVRNLSCQGLGTGSGFAIDSTTLVTNRHVVEGADLLEINTSDGQSLDVSTAEVGVLGDVAFVTVDGALPRTADLQGAARQGSEIAAVGYPLGGPLTITRGVVVDEIDGTRFGIPAPVFRVTAEVQPGNSGGPLLDGKGRVTGVVFAIEIATGLGMALPLESVSTLIQQGGTTAIPPCGGG